MRLLGPEKVAQALAVSRSTARRLMVNGDLPSIVVVSGKHNVIRTPEAELERWLRRKLIENGNGAKRRRRQESRSTVQEIHSVGEK